MTFLAWFGIIVGTMAIACLCVGFIAACVHAFMVMCNMMNIMEIRML